MNAVATKPKRVRAAKLPPFVLTVHHERFRVEAPKRGVGYPVRWSCAPEHMGLDELQEHQLCHPIDGAWHTAGLARVTSAIDLMPKPWMGPWSAKVERLHMLDAAFATVAAMKRDALPGTNDWEHRQQYLSLNAETRLAHDDKPCSACGRWRTFTQMVTGAAGQAKANNKIAAVARDIGTLAHALVDQATMKMLGVSKPDPSTDGLSKKQIDAAKWAFMAWEDWCKKVEFRPLASEMRVFHWPLLTAGAFDSTAMVCGKIGPVDYKTSKAIYREASVQVGRYKDALEWMQAQRLIELPGAHRFETGWIVRLPKDVDDPAFEAVEIESAESTIDVYRALQTIRDWQRDDYQGGESK